MGDDRKDQNNLPARGPSSLMGQLVKQRQGAEVAPSQQGTGLAGGGPATGVGGRSSAPPPGSSNVQRQGTGSHTGVASGGSGRGGVPGADGPTKADIERID